MDLSISWEKLAEEDLGDVRRRIFTGKNVMVVRNIIKPLAVLSAHTHPHEQMIYVVSGECEAFIEGQRFPMKAEDIALVPGDALHQVINTQDKELIILDIFSPIREDFLK